MCNESKNKTEKKPIAAPSSYSQGISFSIGGDKQPVAPVAGGSSTGGLTFSLGSSATTNIMDTVYILDPG
jgi:hypothetical protein